MLPLLVYHLSASSALHDLDPIFQKLINKPVREGERAEFKGSTQLQPLKGRTQYDSCIYVEFTAEDAAFNQKKIQNKHAMIINAVQALGASWMPALCEAKTVLYKTTC